MKNIRKLNIYIPKIIFIHCFDMENNKFKQLRIDHDFTSLL